MNTKTLFLLSFLQIKMQQNTLDRTRCSLRFADKISLQDVSLGLTFSDELHNLLLLTIATTGSVRKAQFVSLKVICSVAVI